MKMTIYVEWTTFGRSAIRVNSGPFSLAIPLCVGAMSNGNGFSHLLGKKRRVLRSSRPCCQDYWNTGLLFANFMGSNRQVV